MANEITVQYALADAPDAAIARWKSEPPEWLTEGGFKLIDESYNGLTYRGSNAQTRFGRLFAEGTYTLAMTFVSDGRFGSRVTITGQAPPKMADAIRAAAAQ